MSYGQELEQFITDTELQLSRATLLIRELAVILKSREQTPVSKELVEEAERFLGRTL